MTIVNGLFDMTIKRRFGIMNCLPSNFLAQQKQKKELNKKTLNNYQDISILNHSKWVHVKWADEFQRHKLEGKLFNSRMLITMFENFAK